MKKVLCFIDNLGAGGAQRQIVGLATFLKREGYDVTVACYFDNGFYVNQLHVGGVAYDYLKDAGNTFFRFWHIARYFHRLKPDVVIAYQETPSICACVAKMFNRKVKLIVSERSSTQHTGFNERIRFNLYRLAKYVVPNSFAQKRYICSTFPFLASKTITIPNFVDLDFFVPPQVRKRRDTPEVVVAASIWPLKNTLGLIEAVSILRTRKYKFHISWYGKSKTNIDYYNKCQEKINQLGVNEYITLKEKTTQIKDCYQEADYFCLPSFFEGTPNVICEAMACGCPILCSDVCDNGQYVKERLNGFLFDPNNASEIAQKIERALKLTEDDYLEFCLKSRQIAEEKLSKDLFINSYINLLEK